MLTIRSRTRSTIIRFLAVAMTACAVPSALGQDHGSYSVQHDFTVTPDDTDDLRVRWVHREYAYARVDGVDRIRNDSGEIVEQIHAAGFAADETIVAEVGETIAVAGNECGVVALGPDGVSGFIRAHGEVQADRNDQAYAYARAASTAVMRVRGGKRLASGRIRWRANWQSDRVAGRISARQGERVRDPIVGRVTDLLTGDVSEHEMLAVTVHYGGGEIRWENDELSSTASEMMFEITMSGDVTLEAGNLRIEVRDDEVFDVENTGMFSGVALPAVGDPGDFVVSLPSEIEIEYELPVPNHDDVAVGLDFDHGGDVDQDDAGLGGTRLATSAIGEGFDGASVSVVEAPSETAGYDIRAGLRHVADQVEIEGDAAPQALMVPAFQLESEDQAVPEMFVQVWDGPPGSGGEVIAGDPFESRLVDCDFDFLYRVHDEDRRSAEAPIQMAWLDISDMGLVPGGTYWFEISGLPVEGADGPFIVPAGRHADDDALVFDALQEEWAPLQDPTTGLPVGVPMAVYGPGTETCPADANGDGAVGVLDLLIVLSTWGDTGGPGDVNDDGTVDFGDLLDVLALWGPCPE